jgi:hypothetical protein
MKARCVNAFFTELTVRDFVGFIGESFSFQANGCIGVGKQRFGMWISRSVCRPGFMELNVQRFMLGPVHMILSG